MTSEALIYMDAVFEVRFPNALGHHFVHDADSNGYADTGDNYFNSGLPFNGARPTIHNDGSNAALLDGHVEWIRYMNLWKIDDKNQPIHNFWKYK